MQGCFSPFLKLEISLIYDLLFLTEGTYLEPPTINDL